MHVIATSEVGFWSVYAADVDRDGDVDAMSASSDVFGAREGRIAWYSNSLFKGTTNSAAGGLRTTEIRLLAGGGALLVLLLTCVL